MPFEIAPQVEAPAKVGRFQEFADAMLLGCAVTTPVRGTLFDFKGGACALGAVFIGMGLFSSRGTALMGGLTSFGITNSLEQAYREKYGCLPQSDNDSGAFTREQIAARIAAL